MHCISAEGACMCHVCRRHAYMSCTCIRAEGACMCHVCRRCVYVSCLQKARICVMYMYQCRRLVYVSCISAEGTCMCHVFSLKTDLKRSWTYRNLLLQFGRSFCIHSLNTNHCNEPSCKNMYTYVPYKHHKQTCDNVKFSFLAH